MLKRLWSSHFMVLLRRIGIVYLLLALCRVAFLIYNKEQIGAIGWDELWPLFRGTLMFDTVSIVYVFALFIILSLLPTPIRERRWYQKVLFWYFIIISAVVCALNLADAVYFNYVGIRLTAADVIFAQNDNTAKLILKFAVESWYLVLIWVGLMVAGWWLYRNAGTPRRVIRGTAAYYVTSILILALTLTFSLAMLRGGGFSRSIRPIHLSGSLRYTPSSAKAYMILSNPFCIIRTISNKGISYTKYHSKEEMNAIYTPYHYPALQEEGDVSERRNVVIMVLESFSAEHSALLHPNLFPDGVGMTPFLDSLMSEGYYFTRSYASGKKSIDALPSILASMPSFKMPFVTMPQSIGKGMQLPKILKGEGYQTMFFCGSPSGSMGFDAYVLNAGVGEIYDKSNFDSRFPDNDEFDNYWGIWDEPFLDYAGEVMSQTQEPFFSALFTVTSHHPFKVPPKYEEVLPDGTTKIHKAVAYTDMSVRRFFEKYSSQEWFKRTIFVFCGDHVSSERLTPKGQNSPGEDFIMSFIYTPDGSAKGQSSSVFQQADIMPTVLGLLRYDKPYFAFGRDAFREANPVAVRYNQYFQIITDSLIMNFDERDVLSVYAAQDALRQHNIASPDDLSQRELQNYLEAYIQQYYTHLERSEYLVR